MSSETDSSSITPNDSAWGQPIARENVSERAYLMLHEALMHGKLKPGEKLLLRPLSKRFGISVTPMREALLRLVSKEALCLDARGTVVVPTLTHEQLLEIRNIRMDLEGRAAERAAVMATENQIDALEAIHQRLIKCYQAGEFMEAVNLNTDFHLTLCRLGGLPILLQIVESLWVRCGPILSHLYDEGSPNWEPHPHVRVLDGLRAQDAKATGDAIRYDIEYGGQGLFSHVAANSAGK